MPESNPAVGTISWTDLTVPAAENVRDFYEDVVGWKSSPVEMGDYQDFCMMPSGSETPVAGICHARGENANLPPQWLIYINVNDLEQSIASCNAAGGKVAQGPREVGGGKFALIQDPAGAYVGLYEQPDNAQS